MPEVRVLSAAQVRELLDPIGLRASLEAALVAQSAGRADVPPRIAASVPAGMLAAMPGFLDDGARGVLATKLVAVFPENVDVPSHQGLIAYFDAATGTPLAVMDAEVITEDRTAMTAAIAADHLARADATVLTIVGAGAQGRAHVHAFERLRPWRQVHIVSRDPQRARELAELATTIVDASTEVTAELAALDAVAAADVIALCTHSDTAVIEADSVGAGTHVSSVGSQAELPVELVGVGPLVVDHIGAVTTAPPAGAAELQGFTGPAIELGAMVAGEMPGRTGPEEITVYKSTGHAVQDLAAAHLVHTRAVEAGVGTVVEL